ncbi:MAG: hypothetical protein IKS17_08910 [Firmicutes bacterium]|nr:hypothetical protein [Bacillota bacterium]
MARTELLAGLTAMSAALLLTWAVEGIVTLLLTKNKKYLMFNVWVNALTNPILNALGIFVAYRFGGHTAWVIYVAVGEVIVLFAEAWLYDAFDRLSGDTLKSRLWYFKLSAVTNALSFAAGVVMNVMLK